MVRLRLRRIGLKRQPSYRIVAADRESPRDGRFLEIVGFYNPRTDPATVNLKEERIIHWLSNGAQPSEAVQRLLKNAGIIDRFAAMKARGSVEIPMTESAAPAPEAAVEAEETVEIPMTESASPVAVAAPEATEMVEPPAAEDSEPAPDAAAEAGE